LPPNYNYVVMSLSSEKPVGLELELHHGHSGRPLPDKPMGLDGWSKDHEERFPGFTTREYNPEKYPAQRIDTYASEASKHLYFIPRLIYQHFAKKIYLKIMGPSAGDALEAFATTPANEFETIENGGLSVREAIGNLAMQGKTGTVLTSHAESLEDVGLYHGPVVLSLAKKRSRFARRAAVFLNKAQTREDYKGKPVEDHFKYFGEIIWTVPDTDSPKKWDISERVSEAVVRGSLRAIKQGLKRGMWLTQAPVGKGMKMSPDPGKEGPESLYQESMSPTTAHIISEFDHFAVAAAWSGKVSLSSLHELPELSRLPKKERQKIIIENANKIHQMLAQQTADLAQIPVIYELVHEAGKNKATALPQNSDSLVGSSDN
jgi:hypothetical protein